MATEFTLKDDIFKYRLIRVNGEEYYSLLTSLDLITSTPFQLLPIKTVWFIEGNIYDRERQDISYQNIVIGGYGAKKGFQYRLAGGVSYDSYRDGQPCIYSEIRYGKIKSTNVWAVILDKVLLGGDYQFIVSGLFCKDRAEYHFNTIDNFHFSKLVSFEIETDYFKTKVDNYKMGSLSLKLDL
jgi:hypothetical protein